MTIAEGLSKASSFNTWLKSSKLCLPLFLHEENLLFLPHFQSSAFLPSKSLALMHLLFGILSKCFSHVRNVGKGHICRATHGYSPASKFTLRCSRLSLRRQFNGELMLVDMLCLLCLLLVITTFCYWS